MLILEAVDPIVAAMRGAIEAGRYDDVVGHAEDLREAAEVIRDEARSSG